MLNTRPMSDEITEKNVGFNFNKLEAAVCIALSAGISITVIILAFRAFG